MVCGVLSPSFLSRGDQFSPEFSKCLGVFQMFGEQELKSTTLTPQPTLPRADNMSLNFQIPPEFPKPTFPLWSQHHYQLFVHHGAFQTQYFNFINFSQGLG